MHSSLLTLAASVSVAAAAVNRGFNYGAVTRDGAIKNEASFTAEFKAAKGLPNTDGAFTSARLYTMIQSGTTKDPISAIPAAISTDTKLFLGMWASSGQTTIDNEIAALQSAITQYGDDFTSRISGISVGSEDLYRISVTGLMNDPLSVGAGPTEVASYIKQVKDVVTKAGLSVPVGHVDTWDVWQNGTNAAVIAASDFLGMNTFPYFQTTQDNSIENSPQLFNDAYDITKNAAGGKPVIITETGFPVSGKQSGSATPSKDNARSYYEAVGCNQLFGNVETYWYTLVDANTDTANQPQFGVVGTTVSTTPLFDLSCDAANTTSTSSTKSATGTASATKSGASASGSGSAKPTTLSATISSYAAGSTAGTSAGSGSGSSNTTVSTASVPGVSSTGTAASGPTSTSLTTTGAASQMKAGSLVALFGAVAAFALI